MQREVSKWLKFLGFRISSKFLHHQLATHPAFPSLLSLTDTLDQLGISNGVIEIDRNNLPELPYPLLAHLKKESEEEILLIKSKSKLLSQPVFTAWDGVVVVAEPQDSFNDCEENLKSLNAEKNDKRVQQLTLLLVSGLIILSASVNFSFTPFCLLVSTLVGLMLSFSITLKTIGINNSVTNTLCATESADCSHVIHSRPFRLPFDLSIAHISFAYFAGLLVYQCLWLPNLHLQGGLNSLFAFSLLTLPVTILSITYQVFHLGKFCRVCLAIVAVLWTQFLLLAPDSSLANINFSDIFVTIIFIGILLFSSILAKQHFLSTQLLRGDVIRLSRFKRDSSIFASRLEQASSIDTSRFVSEIYLGNPHAKLDFLVVCNPHCGACSYAHALLTEILNVHRNSICLRVRFAVNTGKESDNLTATRYLMQLLVENHPELLEGSAASLEHGDPIRNEKLLHEWFTAPDLEAFSKKYPLRIPQDVSQHLAAHEQWTRSAGILFTPTFYINSREYPAGYYLEELKYMVNDLVNRYG